jgi:MFS family permease
LYELKLPSDYLNSGLIVIDIQNGYTAYLVASAVMTPIAGKLSDIYGRKKMVVILMIIYGILVGGGINLSMCLSG